MPWGGEFDVRTLFPIRWECGSYSRPWLPVAGSGAGQLSVREYLVEAVGIERASLVGISVISEGGRAHYMVEFAIADMAWVNC